MSRLDVMKLNNEVNRHFFFSSDGPSLMKFDSCPLHKFQVAEVAEHYGKACIHISALKTLFR
jgi:hypothetical protein